MAVNLPIIIDMGISKHCVYVLGAELVVQTDSSRKDLPHRSFTHMGCISLLLKEGGVFTEETTGHTGSNT